jgi:chemotaxis protein methyltransferase CheR
MRSVATSKTVNQTPEKRASSTVDDARGFNKEMSKELFLKFGRFVTAHLGIKMPDSKKTMLQSRLLKRMRILGLNSYEAYYEYVFNSQNRETELNHMIDSVTTNKTDFFREPNHFDFLVETVLPALMKDLLTHGRRTMRFWSAGCSTGAEPYTLGMLLKEFSSKQSGFQYEILATDISRRVLNQAIRGVYDEEMAAPIPLLYKKKYLLKSKDSHKRIVRIAPEVREMVRFQQLNFMDAQFGVPRGVDIVFCRNVLIYFDRPTQEQVVQRLCNHLNTGGYLFIGHSETLTGLDLPLIMVRPTIYLKIDQK